MPTCHCKGPANEYWLPMCNETGVSIFDSVYFQMCRGGCLFSLPVVRLGVKHPTWVQKTIRLMNGKQA